MKVPPKKLKKGWKIHRDAYNQLIDYIEQIKPIPEHGHTQTESGTMPPPRPSRQQLQFDYQLIEDNGLKLKIKPGYVYAAYRDSDQSAQKVQLAEIQQWPFVPTIGSAKLTDEPRPSISLTNNATNYIYLQLNWTAHKYAIGGHSYDSDYAFEVDFNLDAEGSNVTAASGANGGIHVRIDKTFYTLSSAEFKKYTVQQPPQETALITYIAAGVINLNAKGRPIIQTSPQVEALQWFLQGPIWANKAPDYTTGFSSPNRTEPEPPRRAEDYIYPGAENDT